MKLWTIQPIEFYNELIRNGEIHCFEEYVDSDFKKSYDWLIIQMEKKLAKAPLKIVTQFGLGTNIIIVSLQDQI